jgi:saccharopine dehydrogenase-like NADP-dependent oxidoreductase
MPAVRRRALVRLPPKAIADRGGGRPSMTRILIVGGYGAFGARAAERLAGEPGLEIVIAGRSAAKAAAHAGRSAQTAKVRVAHAELDATTATADVIRAIGARVVINASGPFQAQDYGLARACVGAGCHYVDLADARAFVTGITDLDAEARAAGVAVISGASSVPGLSSAVVQDYVGAFQQLDSVEIGISPGNSFDPGVATAASILAQAGKPHTELRDGRRETVHGWQDLRRRRFAGLGPRWMGSVDVPDLDLLPACYPELQTVRFSAGVEVGLFHLGLWSLSWLVRAGLVRDLAPMAATLLRAKRMLGFLGSDCGGMFVRLSGADRDGTRKELSWHLVARSGHGPYVPAIASVILAKRLAAGAGPAPGAQPCLGLFTTSDFEAEVADLDMGCTTTAEDLCTPLPT